MLQPYFMIHSAIILCYSLCIAYCGNPLPSATNDSLQKVIAYSDMPTTVYFSCPSDLVLTGPNATTCVNNSRWKPDPSKVLCTKADSEFIQLVCMFVHHRKLTNFNTKLQSMIIIIWYIVFPIILLANLYDIVFRW